MPEETTTTIEEEIPAIIIEDDELNVVDPDAPTIPAEGAEGGSGEAAKPESTLDDSTVVEFKGASTTLAELKELAEKGADYTQKTQELADATRDFKAREGAATIAENLWDELTESPESARAAIVKLQGIAAAQHGDSFNVGVTFTDDERQEMDEIERKMVDDNANTRAEIATMRAEFGALKTVLNEIQPILGEVTQSRAINADVARVKTALEIDVTADDIKEAKALSGEKDAVAAVAIWDRKRVKTESAKAATPEPPRTPKSAAREVKDSTNPDDIFRAEWERLSKSS